MVYGRTPFMPLQLFVKNMQWHAAGVRLPRSLGKVGIREHGADCLKRSGGKKAEQMDTTKSVRRTRF